MTDSLPPSWERATLEKIALQALQEQRRARQWSALFKLLWFILAFLVLSAWLGWIGRPDKDASAASGRFTALVDLEGIIAPEGKASADKIIKALKLCTLGGEMESVHIVWTKDQPVVFGKVDVDRRIASGFILAPRTEEHW